jgi:hypothetical protein
MNDGDISAEISVQNQQVLWLLPSTLPNQRKK